MARAPGIGLGGFGLCMVAIEVVLVDDEPIGHHVASPTQGRPREPHYARTRSIPAGDHALIHSWAPALFGSGLVADAAPLTRGARILGPSVRNSTEGADPGDAERAPSAHALRLVSALIARYVDPYNED